MTNPATLAREKIHKEEIREEAAHEDVVEKLHLPKVKTEKSNSAANDSAAGGNAGAPLTLKEIAEQQEKSSVTSTIDRPDTKTLSKKKRKKLKQQEAQAAAQAAARTARDMATREIGTLEAAAKAVGAETAIKETAIKAADTAAPAQVEKKEAEKDRQLTLKESLDDANIEKGIAIKVQGKPNGKTGAMSSVIRDIKEMLPAEEKEKNEKAKAAGKAPKDPEKPNGSRPEQTYKPSYREFMRQSRTLKEGRQPGWLAFRSSRQQPQVAEVTGKELLERARMKSQAGWKLLLQDKWIFLVIILGVVGLHSAFVYLIDSKGFEPIPASQVRVEENIDIKGTGENQAAFEDDTSASASPTAPANDNSPVAPAGIDQSKDAPAAGNNAPATEDSTVDAPVKDMAGTTGNFEETAAAAEKLPSVASLPSSSNDDESTAEAGKSKEIGGKENAKAGDSTLYKILNQN